MQGTSVDTILLAGNTTYHWRGRGRNTCGEGVSSTTRAFTTVANFCRTVNQPLAANSVREDTITVPANAAGVLQNLDIRFVQNNIPASSIRVDLTRLADNRGVRLLEAGCNAGTSINTTFDDAAASPPCNRNPLASRITPTQALLSFDGGSLAGDWRIRVENTGTTAGQFILWCLQPQSLVPSGLFGNGFETP
ncbi:MAG: hypothetical protein IPK97_15835 [Ahniella sp.]|nr:hypothetical protein [Ahniella sp.]